MIEKKAGEKNLEGGPDKFVFRGLLNGTTALSEGDPSLAQHLAELQKAKAAGRELLELNVLVCHTIKCFTSTQKKVEISVDPSLMPALNAMTAVWALKLEGGARKISSDARGALERDLENLLKQTGLDKR